MKASPRILVFSMFAMISVVSAADSLQWVSEQGLYKISYSSSIEPVEINRMHDWVLHVETSDDVAVEGAEISIDGGMSLHDHGLPTKPRVTEYLGNGDYRVRGVRFHMGGQWQMLVTIKVGNKIDTAEIVVEL
jgi:hypothetical protein